MPSSINPSAWSRHRLRVAAAVGGVAIGVAGIGVALPASAEPDAADGTQVSTSVDGVHTVTLITGDRVEVTEYADGSRTVDVEPADQDAPVQTVEADGDLYVLSAAVAPYLAAGSLDLDLFNVTKLIEYGYDDASVDATPLIVQADGRVATRRSEPVPGLELGTPLESIGGAAAGAAHADAADTWAALTATSATARSGAGGAFRGGITAIHLDGKVEASLDSSVPYIGAPEAWAEGYTGDGVTVAVLDTGYDDTHPDLAGAVLPESTSFVPGEEVAADPNGHGTHVASTIAGTGAASGGKNRGVADGADLLIGKVLAANGYGQDSWIIDAMEWAAPRADIVSMSLGTDVPDDGTDPMALALDELAAETGTLFVVAAGNAYDPETIGAPASAARALTVGSVIDPTGEISPFSSEGPLAGSGALKPEIAGPGSNITAAKSADRAGTGPYLTMSGTSMATPHVAGAAAVLKQRHPEYTGDQLRAALMSTANDVGLSSYSVGSGTVDVGAAIDSTVVASGSGDFGMLSWGEDPEPVSRTIDYTNRSGSEVVLDLAATLRDTTPGGAGGDAADAVLSADTTQLTVPAGEQRSVTLTVDPVLVPTGAQLSGALVASIAGQPVARTALGVIAESERYDLTVTATDFEGAPLDTPAWLWDVANRGFTVLAVGGETTVRLPAGDYAVMSFMQIDREADARAIVLAGDPDIELDSDQTVALDARAAEPVAVDVGEDGLAPALRRMDFALDGWRGTSLTPAAVDDIYAQPMDAPGLDLFEFTTRWRLIHDPLSLTVGRQSLDPIIENGSARLDGRLKADLVDAGTGTVDEFAELEVEGKVAVVTRSSSVSAVERARNALAAGAAMLLVVNDADGEFPEGLGSVTEPVVGLAVANLSGVEGRALLETIASDRTKIVASGVADSPEIWDVVRFSDGSVPSDLTYRPRGLAKIETTYHGDRSSISEFRYDFLSSATSVSAFALASHRGLERTEWVSTEDVRWLQDVTETKSGWNIRDVVRTFEPDEDAETGYFGPIVRPYVGQGYSGPVRQRSVLQINLPAWADSGSPEHTGGGLSTATGSGRTQHTDVYVGELLAASTNGQSARVSGLPEAEARLRVVNTTTSDGALFPWTSSTRTEWGFPTSGAATDASVRFVPMLQATYDVDVDVAGLVGVGRTKGKEVPFRFEVGHLAGASNSAPVETASLEMRLAGGEWAPVAVKAGTADTSGPGAAPSSTFATGRAYVAGYSARLTVPDAGAWVDLRVTAADAAGNTYSQEITKAFEVAPARGAKH
ncbi:S8 family peptidase [Agromyces sp. Marseille-Q5079]|uniref:S8 family peptidase n=1 Tax=Agromyces sp. Marseille-Q5079 TaxID=3439059 RepID=UPI003D9C9783